MTKIKVGAASLNQTPLDWERNKKNLIKALQAAKKDDVQILCLPELAITGYGCEDHFLSEEVIRTAWKMLEELVTYTEGMFTCFGLPMPWCNALYNVMVCVFDKEIVGIVPKQHLAGDGIHYEQRWFKPWPAKVIDKIPHGFLDGFLDGISCEGSIDCGDVVFKVGNVRIGFEICEDAFVAERPGSGLARRGVDIIMNPSASHFAFGKSITRERLVIEGSRAFNVTYLYANLLGNEAGRAIYDGDCIIANCGELLARGHFLNMNLVNLTTAVIDLSKARTKIIGTASFTPNLEEFSQGVINVTSDNFYSKYELTRPINCNPNTIYEVKFEEFTKAISLGLWDYLLKSHSKGYVISLSGGADSAACAVLVRIMITQAVSEFGLKVIGSTLGFEINSIDELVNKILTCVYQSTTNSSKTTLDAAKAVAKDIGAKFSVIDIDPIVQQYISIAEQIEGRKLTWETDDLALQNIQARARAPSIWMVANLENKLLITTSNRSEAAVGYCTMDGDTAGSIAPIGGIDKDFLLQWLSSISGSYQSLKLIIKQKPTAELRPGESQTDEEDLMPYHILDAIETWAIVEKKSPREVLDCLIVELKIKKELALQYVRKFFTLWARNQWKREKLPLSLYCDDHSLDPKTWCRFPILSGGFKTELEELEKNHG